jgi:Asp-tRNA(Asn)/Glu-tRNA(Gln) amidotransferase A subunit family amidase
MTHTPALAIECSRSGPAHKQRRNFRRSGGGRCRGPHARHQSGAECGGGGSGGYALERARALDKARASGAAPGPLHGLAVTIKINVDQAGQATSNGMDALKDHIAREDAPVVRNLQAAGAVVIGRTNTPELSFRADTDNPLFGRTHNPWGGHISAGGSSGGGGGCGDGRHGRAGAWQ